MGIELDREQEKTIKANKQLTAAELRAQNLSRTSNAEAGADTGEKDSIDEPSKHSSTKLHENSKASRMHSPNPS